MLFYWYKNLLEYWNWKFAIRLVLITEQTNQHYYTARIQENAKWEKKHEYAISMWCDVNWTEYKSTTLKHVYTFSSCIWGQFEMNINKWTNSNTVKKTTTNRLTDHTKQLNHVNKIHSVLLNLFFFQILMFVFSLLLFLGKTHIFEFVNGLERFEKFHNAKTQCLALFLFLFSICLLTIFFHTQFNMRVIHKYMI